MINWLREVPPTAGLTLCWQDFLPKGPSLEQKLAQFIGVPETQIECSGTAALVVALLTLKNMSARRSVVISAYTCPWVAIAVAHCALKPVLCDTQKDRFELCPSALSNVCNEDTLAIIPTHLGGRVTEIAHVITIAKHIGAYVIEDAAQALGAELGGKSVGTFGDIGFYSLGVGKGLTIFAGGVLVARDTAMRQALRQTSTQMMPFSYATEIRRIAELIGYYLLYRPFWLKLAFGFPLRRHLKKGRLIEAVGDNCSLNFPLHRVSGWRKAVGANALARLPAYLDSTRNQAHHRKSLLGNIAGIQVVQDNSENAGVWPFLLVLMPTEQARDHALNALWHQGLGVGRLFIHALGDYDYLAKYFANKSAPNARDFAARALEITNSPWMRDVDFMKIYHVLLEQSKND